MKVTVHTAITQTRMWAHLKALWPYFTVMRTIIEKATKHHNLPTAPKPYPQIKNWQNDRGGVSSCSVWFVEACSSRPPISRLNARSSVSVRPVRAMALVMKLTTVQAASWLTRKVASTPGTLGLQHKESNSSHVITIAKNKTKMRMTYNPTKPGSLRRVPSLAGIQLPF